MEKKMDELKKAKLIYTIELGIFAVAFLVVAILQFVKVIKLGENHLHIINWISIFAAPLGILDFIWFLSSPVRRKKNSFLDKVLILPLAIYIIVFDIICFINYEPAPVDLAQIMIPCALTYVTLVYTVEAIYHWFKPVPLLYEALEEHKNKENPQEVIDTQVEEVKENNKED